MLQRLLQRLNNIVDPHPYDGFFGSRIPDNRSWLEQMHSAKHVVTLPEPLRDDAHTGCLVRTYLLPSGSEVYLWSIFPDTLEGNLIVPGKKWMQTHLPLTAEMFEAYLAANPAFRDLPVKWKHIYQYPENVSLPHRAKDFEIILAYLKLHPHPWRSNLTPSKPKEPRPTSTQSPPSSSSTVSPEETPLPE